MTVRWLVVVVLALAGCGGESPSGNAAGGGSVRGVSDGEIVVGTHTDLVGATAIWGVGSVNGARMRFDELNAAGGVHGRRVRFVVEDAQYQVPRAVQAANKLINRDGIFAMLLAVGTPMNNAVMTQQFEAGVPNIFPVTGARSMVEPLHPLKFTQRGIYYDEIRAAVKYFVEERGRQAVCAIYQDTEYGQEILEAVQDQVAAMNLSIAETSAHHPTQTEFTAAILRLRRAGCDLVLMGTVHRDTILVLDAARKMGWTDVDWVGNNATYAQAIADAEAADGYYAFVHMARLYADDDMPAPVRTWWDGYVAAYRQEPDLAAMEGYRAADVFVLALERAGRDLTLQGFLAALEGIDDYTDLFGYRLSFGPDKHSGASESVLSQVQNRRWVELEQSITY
ncbi:MAG: ABC transporter substrate-binding protein [Pseudomonadales bacterium]|nr:ABC transporter substrate-binding protein [Pseudomonadales bacterium]